MGKIKSSLEKFTFACEEKKKDGRKGGKGGRKEEERMEQTWIFPNCQNGREKKSPSQSI